MSEYGFCPQCDAPGLTRERRPNGNDSCVNGHIYPSRTAKTKSTNSPSFEHYMNFVNAGVSLSPDTFRERTLLAGMGLAGEAGEVCDHAKKVGFHGVEMDRNALIKELGDVLWYFALMLHTYNITLDEVMINNIFKLCNRYPENHGAPWDIVQGKAI